MQLQIMKFPQYLHSTKNIPPKKATQKIVPLDFFCRNNIVMSNHIIKIIPYYYHYFLPMKKYKKLTLDEKKLKYILISLPNGKTFPLIHKNIKTSNFFFIESYRILFDIIKIMNEYNFVHFNISKNSIIFIHERPYLQDFSQSFFSTSETIDYLFECYQPRITNRPPSWHLACYLRENKLTIVSMNNIDQVLQDYIDFLTPKIMISVSDFLIEFRESWAKYLHGFLHKTDVELIQICIRESKLWDTYGISFLYLKHINQLSDDIFIQKFFDFLKKNMCSYCEERFDNIFIS